MEFSTLTPNVRKSIINTGEVESGIIIELVATGTVVNPVNFTMEINDKIIINTYQGKKSVTLIRNGENTNIMGNLTPDSKWLSLEVGDNVFTYDSDSGNSNLQITFITTAMYGGV